MVRQYLAVKMMLSATILLKSLGYSLKTNVRIVESYLTYYSILCCSRAWMLTHPRIDWKDGEVVEATHSKIINITADGIRGINSDEGKTVHRLLLRAKALRETFSYRFPASGFGVVPSDAHITFDEAVNLCCLLCELTQINTEVLEASLKKNAPGHYGIIEDVLERCFYYEFKADDGTPYIVSDDEDYSRVEWMSRKFNKPCNLYHFVSEGMVEEFFFSWAPPDEEDESSEDMLHPEQGDWGIIYPFP